MHQKSITVVELMNNAYRAILQDNNPKIINFESPVRGVVEDREDRTESYLDFTNADRMYINKRNWILSLGQNLQELGGKHLIGIIAAEVKTPSRLRGRTQVKSQAEITGYITPIIQGPELVENSVLFGTIEGKLGISKISRFARIKELLSNATPNYILEEYSEGNGPRLYKPEFSDRLAEIMVSLLK